MPRHVVFLGPDLFAAYIEMVRGLKEVGARVTAIGHTPTARLDPRLKRHLDDYVRVGSLLEPRTVVEAAQRVRSIDRIETGDENLVTVAAEVREALRIPGLSVRSATLCRDKPAMKEALRQAGIPTAASARVSSLTDLEAFAEREGYPLVLKPTAALGGLGTFRVENAVELRRAAANLGIDQGKTAAVEEWVEGHEGFFDTLTVGGRVVHEYVSHYYPNVLAALGDRTVAPQIAATNRVESSGYDEVRTMGRRVITALGIETSATHMEWFFGPKGLKFSEIGARPPGERIWDLYSVGNDIDLWREWAMVMVHGQPGARPSRRFATGSVQVRPDRDGRIVGYEGLRDVVRALRPYLTEYRVPRLGTPTDPIYKGYLNNVWFRLKHPDYDELRRLMDFAGRRLGVRAA